MEKLQKYKKYLLIIPALIPAIVLVTVYLLNKNKTIEIYDAEDIKIIEEKKELIESKKIKVDVKGEVKKPGIQELDEHDRVGDAIEKAGGLTESADTELINLSKNLKDEMVIIVYNKHEIEKIKSENNKPETIIKYIEKKCTCPDKINDACIKEKTNSKENAEEDINAKVSINKATVEELIKVDGIGESKAKAIIKYREENGNFETIDDIKKVSGIGESTFEKFKDNITI